VPVIAASSVGTTRSTAACSTHPPPPLFLLALPTLPTSEIAARAAPKPLPLPLAVPLPVAVSPINETEPEEPSALVASPATSPFRLYCSWLL
jgi:hypothetical protein